MGVPKRGSRRSRFASLVGACFVIVISIPASAPIAGASASGSELAPDCEDDDDELEEECAPACPEDFKDNATHDDCEPDPVCEEGQFIFQGACAPPCPTGHHPNATHNDCEPDPVCEELSGRRCWVGQ